MTTSVSSLPSWAGQDAPGTVRMKLRDSFHTAPGWRQIGVRYSAVPDARYAPQDGVLEAIREFFPEAVYLKKLWVFRSPSEETDEHNVVFVRHCIGSYVWNPRTFKPGFHVEMPAGADFLQPNQVDIELMQAVPKNQRHSDLPGGYLPFNWGAFHYLRILFDQQSARARKERYIRRKLEKFVREANKRRIEIKEMQMEAQQYFQKKFDQISDVEIDEYLRSLDAIREQRQKDFYAMVARAEEAKPKTFFVSRKDS